MLLLFIVREEELELFVPKLYAIPLFGFIIVPFKINEQDVRLNDDQIRLVKNIDDKFEVSKYETLKLQLFKSSELPFEMLLNKTEQLLTVEVKVPENELFQIVVCPAVCCPIPTNRAW